MTLSLSHAFYEPVPNTLKSMVQSKWMAIDNGVFKSLNRTMLYLGTRSLHALNEYKMFEWLGGFKLCVQTYMRSTLSNCLNF